MNFEMNPRTRKLLNQSIALVLLVAMVSCNVSYIPSFKAAITDSEMKPAVASVIDEQMKYIKDYLDEDLKAALEGGSSKGGPLSGADIVELTLDEDGGRDYLDFCYAVGLSEASPDVSLVMDTAQSVLSEEDYERLKVQAQELEQSMNIQGDEYAKGLPLNQQEAFYKDLKTLVTRSVVLLVAGIVYAAVPNLVFWGKISAAAAIAVGAGLVAISIMSLYEYYKYGAGEGVDFEAWFKELIAIPKADFALTTSITAMAEALGMGPVVTGIIICVFAIYNIVGMVRTMLKTYNFDA